MLGRNFVCDFNNYVKRVRNDDFTVIVDRCSCNFRAFKLRYLNKAYSFAVNGQTGKIVGELPSERVQKWVYFLKRFVPIAGIVLGGFVLKYFLGG